jgi:hypothetical protein
MTSRKHKTKAASASGEEITISGPEYMVVAEND